MMVSSCSVPGVGCSANALYPVDDDLDLMYEQSWLSPKEHKAETGGTNWQLAGQYAELLRKEFGDDTIKRGSLLEIGAGTGLLCLAFMDLGSNICAIEPYGYERLVSLGVLTFRSTDELDPSMLFDGIIMIDVLEHILNPLNMLKKVYEKLVKGGWVLVATPNALGIQARLHRSRWREAKKCGHLHLFTANSMKALFRCCGFASFRRLSWFIKYPKSTLANLVVMGLTAIRLDGELRFLAFK